MQAIQQVFEQTPLTVLTIEGRQWFLAQEIGRVLGYGADGSELSKKIRQRWTDDIVEGQECKTAEKQLLKDIASLLLAGASSAPASFEEAPATAPTAISPKTRKLLLLSEEGVYLVCMKTNKPIGVRLRRWLAYEVLPKLRRQEAIVPAGDAGELVKLEEQRHQQKLENAEQRRQNRIIRLEERKLDLEARQVAIEEDKQALAREVTEDKRRRDMIKFEWWALAQLEKTGRIDPRALLTTRVSLVERAVGDKLGALVRKSREWMSPTEMAIRWRTTPQHIGDIVTRLKIDRGKPPLSRAGSSKARNKVDKVVTVYEYNVDAQRMIYDELMRERREKGEGPAEKVPDL